MKTLQTAILVPVLLLNAAAGFPAARGDKYASWDDVNVVAHGLLQLGQGLKEHVMKTKAQMRDVNSQLKAFNATIVSLERNLHPRLTENCITFLSHVCSQRVVAAQNRRIDHLVDKIKQQQDKLDKQSLHLLTLQNKVSVSPAYGKNNTGFAQDCHDLFVRGQRTSGIYTIQAQNSQPFNVLCEMTTEGGWTVIQKRLDGSENFNHLWESYQKGFGSLNGEFWLGLENIHTISEQGQYLLQVELTDSTGESHANLYRVQIDGKEKNYALHLEQNSTSGAQGGSLMTGAAGLPFSTADRDNDLAADVNCAELHSGGWWFSSCGASNLNGKYPRRPGPVRWQPRRMFWTNTMGQKNSLSTTLMKLAPISISQQ
uniref:Angiopoietin-related protein 4-like n=1 Tax=Hippocampus comes TaxID=109280 RepID=A0A3Q3DVH0_HIPCM